MCPLVGESLRVEAKSATEEYERLSADELSGLRVGLMHGQMATAAREEVMERFRAGEVQVLVATTVIEVGVDVPEATVMVIESADRFGIAQLHQLRGRVGRGQDASWCYLLGGEDGNERLAEVAASTDGFALAEADLRIRGEGTLLGARQKGESDLRLASLSDERRHRPARRRQAGGRVDRRRGPPTGGARRPARRGRLFCSARTKASTSSRASGSAGTIGTCPSDGGSVRSSASWSARSPS